MYVRITDIDNNLLLPISVVRIIKAIGTREIIGHIREEGGLNMLIHV